MIKPAQTVGACLALLVAAPGQAQDYPYGVKFSGFGTLAATRSSEKNADFITNFSMPNGAGYSRSIDVGMDSRVGVQMDVRLGDYFWVAAQAVSERRYDDTYKPYLSMGFLKLKAHPNLSLRVGRVPYAAYLISDFQKVGYAQPWVRPPVEVYQFNPLTFVDGADVTWQLNLGSVALTTKVVGGTSNVNVPPSTYAVRFAAPGTTPEAEWKSSDLGAISVAAVYRSATFRVFHLQMKGTYNDPGFDGPVGPVAGMSPFRALRVLPPGLGGNPALANQFQITGDKLIYESAAFNYDPGDWFFMLEQTQKRGDENMFLHFRSGYGTVGIRAGNWTPYFTAGWKRTTSPTTHPNPIVNAIVSGLDRGQDTLSLGLRWDFYKNMDLKLQFDAVKHRPGSYGATTNVQPTFKPGESYNLATLALDFVF